MIVTMNKMLETAKSNKQAIPQFNINNLEWTRYVLEAANETGYPIILGVSEGAAKYIGGFNTVVGIIKNLYIDLNINIDVAIHLDHASSTKSCIKAIDAGFTSVMIDASKHDLETNIKITNEVMSYVSTKDISVEGEIGHIGGTEDGHTAGIMYANVKDCEKYVTSTKINCLAPAAGSVHGLYSGEPNINFKLIEDIHNKLDLPLVLHGGSGLSNEIIREAITNGICKVNFNTQLQIEWAKAVRKFIKTDSNVYDPRKIISSGKEAIKNVVYEKIELLKNM